MNDGYCLPQSLVKSTALLGVYGNSNIVTCKQLDSYSKWCYVCVRIIYPA